jgi:ABC-type uncharacterized transport system permease subunit
MMVQVSINRWARIVVYLLIITGISLLGTKLSSVVAQQAIVLALPHLDNGPPKLSLIEKRRIDAALAAQLLPEGARKRVIALETPAMPANLLAARLDLAEKEDLPPTLVALVDEGALEPASQASSIAVRVSSYETTKGQTVRSHSRHADISARDVFNRSFGVLSVASN